MFKRKPRPADREPWTRGQITLAVLLVLLGIGITVPAFAYLYRTAVDLLAPWMGWWARAVPICGEIAFTFLFLNGVLLQLRRAPSGAVRNVFMGLLIVGSVAIQIMSAHGVMPSVVGHTVVVAAFFGVMLSGKSTIMSLRGGKVRADSITPGEWIAHPVHSTHLWRWMKIWGEPSRDQAQDRYMRLLLAIAVAQEDPHVGSGWGWRRKLPVTLRYELATGTIPSADRDDWADVIARHVAKQLPSARETTHRWAAETLPPDGSPRAPSGDSDSARDGTANGRLDAPAGRPARGTATRTPDYTRSPSKSAVAKMSTDELANYVRAWIDAGNTPSIRAVRTRYHCADAKAKGALVATGMWGEDAQVVAGCL